MFDIIFKLVFFHLKCRYLLNIGIAYQICYEIKVWNKDLFYSVTSMIMQTLIIKISNENNRKTSQWRRRQYSSDTM